MQGRTPRRKLRDSQTWALATSPKRKCLLEIDTSELLNSKINSQQYWLYAVEATRTAGSRALKISDGKTVSWNDIIQNGKYINLPIHNPPVVNKPHPKAKQ